MRPPSVDALARSLADIELPHPLLVDVARQAITAGDPGSARRGAEALQRDLLQGVINATGVLLHTNLGRAPLGLHRAAGYSNLELDLATGRRGQRDRHAAALLARLCGAEDALVVNNGAAAILLVLRALAAGRSVAVSRGELVEIGGGFRIPEILAESGARLVEVGTTNRTNLSDYATAVDRDPDVALVLKVHPSNYRMTGFTHSVPVAELRTIDVPVVADLGSGLLDARCPWLADGPPPWLADEPGALQAIEDGAELVTFSGDKLLGGPQAGIVAGRREAVERCRQQPLARALRPGAHILDALQLVALAYLRRDDASIPFWRMAVTSSGELGRRATDLVSEIGPPAHVITTSATIGGGAAPETTIPSVGVALPGDLAAALREGVPPIIARVTAGRTVLDLRTIDPDDVDVVASAVKAALEHT